MTDCTTVPYSPRIYTHRARTAAQIAPVAPPCFPDRLSWQEYVSSAAEEQRHGHPPVLLIERGEPVRFNFQFNYCRDCTAEHALSMTAQGRCQPEHLKRRATDANR